MPEVDEVLSLTGIAFANDRLMLPDEQIRPEPCATDRRHKFVKKSTPERLRLHLLKDFEPLPGLHYTLLFDELILNGQTGSEGILDHRISPRSRFGKLLVPSTSGRAISAVRFRFIRARNMSRPGNTLFPGQAFTITQANLADPNKRQFQMRNAVAFNSAEVRPAVYALAELAAKAA